VSVVLEIKVTTFYYRSSAEYGEEIRMWLSSREENFKKYKIKFKCKTVRPFEGFTFETLLQFSGET